MSWDVFIQDMPKNIKSISEIPDDFKPSIIGSRKEIILKIISILPNVDFSDES